MTVSNNSHNLIPPESSSNLAPPSTTSKLTGQSKMNRETTKNVDFTKVARFFRDSSLGVSLRHFTHQITECTNDILASNLSDKEKIATVKTAIIQLKGAVEGRRTLIGNLSIIQKAEIFVLHGKTTLGLQKNLETAEKKIGELTQQLEKLQSKEAEKNRTKGKPLPATPQFKIPVNMQISLQSFTSSLFDPATREEIRPLISIMASTYGVSQTCNELRDAIVRNIEKAPRKEIAVKNAIEIATTFLASVPPSEMEKPEKRIAFFKLVLEIYKHPEAKNDNRLVIACNRYFGNEQFKTMVNGMGGHDLHDGAAVARLEEHITATPIAPSTTKGPQKEVADLGIKLMELASEKNKGKYREMIKEIGQALSEDSIVAFKEAKDSDVFDPGKSTSAQGIKPIEDKLRLFMLDPNISLAERTRRVEVILDLAQFNLENKNYHAATTLANIIITREVTDQIPVSTRHKEIKAEFKKIIDPTGSYKGYRDRLNKHKGENYIPFLAAPLKDLTLLRETATKTPAPTMSILQTFAKQRKDYFNARDFARSQPPRSAYTFLSANAEQEIFTSTQNITIAAKYTGPKTKDIEEYQQYLRRQVKTQLNDKGITWS